MRSRLADSLKSFRALPRWVQVWTALILVPTNLLPFLWLDTPTGRAGALATGVVMLGGLPIMLAERGLSRLMSVPHLVAWIPLVVLLVARLALDQPMSAAETGLAITLIVVDGISLGFDAFEFIHWCLGNRTVPGMHPPTSPDGTLACY
jgi:hypothetical protein